MKFATFRSALFQIHLWVGLVLGVLFVAVSLSGSILVYDDKLTDWIAPPPKAVTAGPPVPLTIIGEYARRVVQAEEGGQIQFLISGPPGVLPHITSTRLKAIATTAAKRSPGLPDTPTFAESGLPGFDTYEWYGVFAPGKMPPDVLAKLSKEIARIINLPDMSEKLSVQGAIPVGNTPAEFSVFVKREMDTWGKVAQQVGLKPD